MTSAQAGRPLGFQESPEASIKVGHVTARIALLGHPLHQSLSPLMQGAAMRDAGIDGSYELLDVAPQDFPRSLQRVRDGEFLGCNVTMPYKESVVELLDGLDDDAARILAVNTVTRDDQSLIGHNTDSYGVLKAAEQLMGGVRPAETDVVLLGAGGAGRATAYSLVRMGFPPDLDLQPQPSTSRALCADFADLATDTMLESQALEMSRAGLRAATVRDLLVNATSVGFNSDVSPVPANILPAGIRVFDVIYSPLETRLLRDARAAGAVAVTNGIPMVIHQGARAFELWFGRSASIEVMTRALAGATPASAATPHRPQPSPEETSFMPARPITEAEQQHIDDSWPTHAVRCGSSRQRLKPMWIDFARRWRGPWRTKRPSPGWPTWASTRAAWEIQSAACRNDSRSWESSGMSSASEVWELSRRSPRRASSSTRSLRGLSLP